MTRRPWVKVCGLTRPADAAAAVAAGADAVGVILVPASPRAVTPDAARAVLAGLPPEIARVGVVVDAPVGTVRAWVATVGLTAIQAHGDEPPEACRAYGVPVVKAFPAGPGFDPSRLEPYREFPILLDGAAEGKRGGTGRPADWEGARRAVEAGFRVLLAGGLGPETVRPAVERVAPIAVDLNSGVETAPGRKDPARIAAALEALRDLAEPEASTWPW